MRSSTHFSGLTWSTAKNGEYLLLNEKAYSKEQLLTIRNIHWRFQTSEEEQKADFDHAAPDLSERKTGLDNAPKKCYSPITNKK